MNRQTATTPLRTPPLLAVTLTLYQRLLLLHPADFRRDYATAIMQVFRQTCLDAYRVGGPMGIVRLWIPACTDLLGGALAEHGALLIQTLKGSSRMLQTRRSASLIFAAFIAFVIVGIGFQKSSEDIMKTSLPGAHPLLAVAYDTLAVAAVVALLAVLIGGVPVAFAALRYALANRRGDILARFLVPPVALLVIVAAGFVVVAYNIGGNTAATIHSPARIAAIGSLAALFIVGAIISASAVLSAIARSDISERLFRFALLPGALATIAMLAMLVADIAWSFALWQNAPSYFWGNEGILASSTLVGTVVQGLVMLIATLIAIRALARGLSARTTTPQIA